MTEPDRISVESMNPLGKVQIQTADFGKNDMSIQTELAAFLERRLRDADTKDRNIDLIAHFYGFRDSPWPTLEETAGRFSISTRERVRQIVDKYFRNIVQAADLPSLPNLSTIVSQRQYWLHSELRDSLKESQLIEENFSIRGLFNLMTDLGMSNDYGIFAIDSRWNGLRKATRSSMAQAEETFVIKNSDLKAVNSIYKKARTLPGQYGLSNFEYLDDVVGKELLSQYGNLVSDLIRNSNVAWFKETDLGMWYMFEDRDNILVNFSEKVFSLINECEIARLAEVFHNALRGRPQKREHPSLGLIEEYLESSLSFVNTNDVVRFANQPDVSLNQIEKDLVAYFETRNAASFKELRTFLSHKGYGRPHIIKATNTSPIVHVDRSGGQGFHVYTLVGNPRQANDRYAAFLRELGSIHNTDESLESKTRREQDTLRRWLFEGKCKENCAICGKEHMVTALVAAHKKRRRDCNERERRDPHIVMPICVFGCDFLYERRHIVVDEGFVRENLVAQFGAADVDYLNRLIGRKLDDKWLEGDSSYFTYTINPWEDS